MLNKIQFQSIQKYTFQRFREPNKKKIKRIQGPIQFHVLVELWSETFIDKIVLSSISKDMDNVMKHNFISNDNDLIFKENNNPYWNGQHLEAMW